jgi:hypothetical protein
VLKRPVGPAHSRMSSVMVKRFGQLIGRGARQGCPVAHAETAVRPA